MTFKSILYFLGEYSKDSFNHSIKSSDKAGTPDFRLGSKISFGEENSKLKLVLLFLLSYYFLTI